MLNSIIDSSIHQSCSIKKLFFKTSKYSQINVCWSLFLVKLQAFRFGISSSINSNTNIFLRILQNFWEDLSWWTSANDCFCIDFAFKGCKEEYNDFSGSKTSWCHDNKQFSLQETLHKEQYSTFTDFVILSWEIYLYYRPLVSTWGLTHETFQFINDIEQLRNLRRETGTKIGTFWSQHTFLI